MQPILNSDRIDAPQSSSRTARRKRNLYTLVACTLCKSRKVKCDGRQPCECCAKRGLRCVYRRRANIPNMSPIASERSSGDQEPSTTPGDETTRPDSSNLSSHSSVSPPSNQTNIEVGTLSQLAKLEADRDVYPLVFRPPIVDTFNLAKYCLEAKDLAKPAESVNDTLAAGHHVMLERSLKFDVHYHAEPVLDLGYDRAKHIFSTFTQTIQPIYPCVNLPVVGWLLDAIFGRIPNAETNKNFQPGPISITRIDILKAILGLTLSVEGDVTSPLALHLHRYVDWTTDKLILGKGPEIDDIIMASLMCLYYFHKFEQVKAWRLIGLASKACYELRLHQPRKQNPTTGETHASSSQQLFWSVYVLDHTLSFATNLPQTMKDGDIDDNFLESGALAPFIITTIEYSRLNSKVLELLARLTRDNTEIRQKQEYLDYRIQSLLEKFRNLVGLGQSAIPPSISCPQQYEMLMFNLETFIAIRVNHCRMTLRQPLLQSYTADQEKRKAAVVSIECAKEIISLCSRVNSQSVPLKFLHNTYEYFMVASLATILLVVSQDPESYGAETRDSFHEAIATLRLSQCRHFKSAKLCFTLEQLAEIGGYINMPKDDSSAALQDMMNEVEIGKLLLDLQSPISYSIHTFDDSAPGLLDINQDWPFSNTYF